MVRKTALLAKQPSPFPSREELIRFIHESDRYPGKREIARAFRLNSQQKMELKKTLREMELDGTLQKGRGRRYSESGTLPTVCILEITGFDTHGELLAAPVVWENDTPKPIVCVSSQKSTHPSVGNGDRILARILKNKRTAVNDVTIYEGKIIRRLATSPANILGILEGIGGRFRLKPTDRRNRSELLIEHSDSGGATHGDLVRVELFSDRNYKLKRARVIENLASTNHTQAASVIALHHHDLPIEFSRDAIKQAKTLDAAPMEDREDLRHIPLVTIDGADARDFDDAVWAQPDTDDDNQNGWHVIVAIADVSWYVQPGSALDSDAYKRGNSVYFPDRVIPMLPEPLSSDLCSLVPYKDRPCIAVHMWISEEGKLIRHSFSRAMIKSHARLTYAQVEAAKEGRVDEVTRSLRESVILPLYGAFKSLARARETRGVLELDIPERQVLIDDENNVVDIVQQERLDSHKLIEEMMIASNVAVAQMVSKKQQPCLYRIHDQPSMEKMEILREFLGTLNFSLPKDQVIRPSQFNTILKKAKKTPSANMVNTVILRSQSQAEYTPNNIGHFGLNLDNYCHFTSPIRRYSDLVTHRILIQTLKLGNDGFNMNHGDLITMGDHLSSCERRASSAERDSIDRFTAGFLSDHINTEFIGCITGVTRFGLFVMLDDNGADGLVPISTLPDDYYRYDSRGLCLRGDNTGRTFTLGQRISVILAETEPITGSISLRLISKELITRSPTKSKARHNTQHKRKKRSKRKFGNIDRKPISIKSND